ncbi:MAG TPA: hypothetical protein VHP31_12215 [Caproicibacter sp.]|nr:hypothetical protein [Caproicibacter sp.]
MDDELIRQYQADVTMLYKKRMELRQKLSNRRHDYEIEQKRLRQLDEMYRDTVYALHLLVRSKLGYNNFCDYVG